MTSTPTITTASTADRAALSHDHPHLISAEALAQQDGGCEHDRVFVFRPFTGSEPEPQWTFRFERGVDAYALRRQYEHARDLWLIARRLGAGAAVQTAGQAAEGWRQYQRSLTALDEAFRVLHRRSARRWPAALLHLAEARAQAASAAQSWKRLHESWQAGLYKVHRRNGYQLGWRDRFARQFPTLDKIVSRSDHSFLQPLP